MARRRLVVESLEDRRMLATFTVSNLLDGPVTTAGQLPGSLRQAIFDSNAMEGADEIEFSDVAGTLFLTEGQLEITEALSISGPGSEQFIIDAQDLSRVFVIDDPDAVSENFEVEIRGVTLTRGAAPPSPGNPGGAILASGLIKLTLSQSTIIDSNAGGSGGAIDGYELEIIESTISGNTAGSGGGISGFVVNVVDSNIQDNTSSGSGGGISGNTVTVLTSTIQGNTTTGLGAYGGGIGAYGDVSITSSTISGNSTTGNTLFDYYLSRSADGGGVASYAGNIAVTNSTVSNNSVTGSGALGGGIAAFQGEAVVTHSTITQNSRGGVRAPLGGITLGHTIVANNPGAAELATFSTLDVNYSLVGTTAGLSGGQISAINAGDGNLTNVDPLLGPLADNGGTTLTHVLLTGSPALDAGDEFVTPGIDVPEFDQRGTPFSRIFDGNNDTIARIDMGAVETDTFLFIVDSLDDHSNGDLSEGNFTLREAIQQATFAGAGSVIQFADELFASGPATIVLDPFQQLEITTSMVIQGPGADLLTIEGQNSGRLIYIDNADSLEQVDVAIRSVTLTGGNDLNGGGAIFSQERLEIADSVITGNAAQWGGGVYNAEFGELTVVNSVVSGNTATSSGGGLYNWGGTTFIFDSTISDNDSATYGGGILNANNGALTISRSTLSGNDAEMKGGGLHNGDGNVQIAESTFNGNTADFGGGIYLVTPNDDTTTLFNSTVSNNIATLGGAGLFNFSGRLVIQLSTVTENNSNDFAGSGVVTWGDSTFALTEIYSTIVAGNHHTDVAVAGGLDDTFQSNGYNLIGIGSLSNFTQMGDQTGIADPLLSPLADNGGPTFTHALLVGSPALNAGDPSIVSSPEFDQRGVGFNRVIGGQVDIGAYEIQTIVVPPSADFDGDEDVDGRDFLLWQRGFGIVAPDAVKFDGDADDDTDVDGVDLGIWQDQYATGELSEVSSQLLAGDDGALPFMAAPVMQSVRSYEASENDINVSYVEEVDRAIEQYAPTTSFVRSFGEMATRRSAKRIAR